MARIETSSLPTWNLAPGETQIELHFPERPPREIRESLRRLKWRWSAESQCWYARRTATNEQLVQQFCASGKEASGQSDELSWGVASHDRPRAP
jgi:hypothetical protein